MANRVSSLVSSNSVCRSSFRPARRRSPPCSRIFFESDTSTPNPEESMYPVLVKSMTNLRAPPSRESSTFCFMSWRFPTISCPSTPTTTTPRLSFVRLKVISAPRLEGRRPPPCPQYRRPSHRATGRRRGAPGPGGWARSPPTRRAAAPVCTRCCRCQDRETPARSRDPPRASPAPCGGRPLAPAPRRPAARHRRENRGGGRAVGEGQHRLGTHHVERATDGRDPGRGADAPERRPDGVPARKRGSADH